MANNIPFSVLIPVYKGDYPEYFHEALESVFGQSTKADEVVVVADGPLTADLDAVLQEWETRETTLKVVRREVNGGLSEALNTGIAAASHEWIARMDADDWCMPHRFEVQLERIKSEPELALLGSSIDEYDETLTTYQASRKLPSTHDEVVRYAKWRCPFNHMTVFYRKSALNKLGCYKNYGAVGDDYELWARFIVNGYRVGNIAETLVKARTGDDFFHRRRRGMKYLQNELKEITDLRELGLINYFQFTVHAAVKTVVRLAPPSWIKGVYGLLRK